MAVTVIPASERDLKGHLGHLDDKQQAAFDEFKKQVQATVDNSNSRQWYDDATLLRFLRARSYSVPKAMKQFTDSDKWRKETGVDNIYENFDVEEFEAARVYYPRWTGRRDLLGRPVYVYRLGSLTNEHQKELFKAPEARRYQRIICLTEVLIRFVFGVCSYLPTASSPTPISCVTTIIDLDKVSLGSLWSLRGHLQQSISLSSANYPETLNTIAIVNAPSFFPTIWGWIKVWFDEGTRNKIHVLGSDPGPTLRELIKPQDLPKIYGGELEWKFEDEPILDDELKAVVGDLHPRGPVIWQDDKPVLLGSGRS